MRGSELGRVARYLAVGGSTVVLDFVLFAGLLAAGVGYVGAKAASLVSATAFAYLMHHRWTFGASSHSSLTVGRYLTVQGSALALNLLGLAVLVDAAGLHPLVAQAVVVPVIALASFLAQRHWTFAQAAESAA